MSKLADELKKAFLQGNVPNETNYQKLIELADPQLGNGLKVKEINVAGKDNNPATTQTVIELNNGAGIGFDESGAAKLNLDPSLAIEVNGYNQLSVKLADGSGLEKTSKGLGVKCGPGIKTDTSGLSVSLASEGGLVQDSTDGGLRVHLYTEGNTDTSGLTIDNKNQLQVKLPEQVAGKVNYLKQDKDGLHLTQEGIDSMKSAMAAVSKQALDDAKKDTSNGFIALDSKSKKSQTEKDIANALNAAYADGRSHEKECNAVIDFLNSNLRSDWKDKIVNGTAVMSAFNKTDGTFYTKGEKEGDEPQPFSHDCLWVFNLDSNGRFERLADNHPEDVKAYNPGLYFIVGLLSKEGKPDQKGEYVTEYASLVLCSHRAPVVVAYAKLGTDSPSLFANPVADPGAFKAGYDSGKKDKVALRKAVEDAVNGAIGATQVKDGKWTPLQGEGGTIGERAVADAMKMSYDAGDKDGFNRGSTDTVAINADRQAVGQFAGNVNCLTFSNVSRRTTDRADFYR